MGSWRQNLLKETSNKHFAANAADIHTTQIHAQFTGASIGCAEIKLQGGRIVCAHPTKIPLYFYTRFQM